MTTETTTASPEFVAKSLTRFLTDQLKTSEFEVVDLHPIGVGRSRDNWVFDLVRHGTGATTTREPLILRCDPAGGLVDTDRSTEFALLRCLEPDDVPSPEARWLDSDGAWFGRPALIMHRLPGTCDYRLINGGRPLAERRALARQFCDLLAQVHAVDWRRLGLGQVLPDPGISAARYELDRWEAILRKDQLEPWPELDLAIVCLRGRAPDSARTVLVHADFKPGNILLDGDRVSALLDWELAHLGDPLEDLGWVTQPLRTAEHLIEGTWEREDLIARYLEVSGHEVDPVALDWWTTFSTFKTAVMQVSGLRAFLQGHSDQPYRPTRRVLRTLLDALADWS